MTAETSTHQRVFRSTMAAYAIQIARLLIGFGTRLVLARLILPEGHGLFELALRIVTVAAAVRDLGLPYQVVRDERRPYGTVLAFTLGSGTVITLLLIAAAPIAGILTPDLPTVLRVMAVWVLLDGLAVVPKAFFERELTLQRLIGPEIARVLIFGAVSIGLSLLKWGVWSFVAGELASVLIYGLWAWAGAWKKFPFRAELRLLPELIRQSSYLFWIWLLVQLVTYIDIYIIEWFVDTEEVGLYTNAYKAMYMTVPIAYPRALFPTLVAYLGDRPRFLEAFRLGAVQLLSLQVLACYFLFYNPEKSITVLFGGGEWLAAVPLLQLLAFVPLFDPFSIVGGEMLKARNEDRLWLAITALNLISLVGFGILLTREWGAVGMAAANWLRLGSLLMLWRVRGVFGDRFRSLLGDLAFLYLAPLPFFALAAWALPPDSWARFAASIVAALLAAGTLAARYWRPFRTFFGK
jgi:O-antigen/teichoic acid export membrane protein